MSDDVNTHVQRIAQALAGSAPAGWSKAKVSTEIDSDTMSTSEYDYVDGDGNEHEFDPDTLTTVEIGSNLRAIRAAAVASGQEAWSRCTFLLSKDGTFKFDVAYDS